MTMQCIDLAGGRRLQNRRGRWVMLPDETGVEVRVEGNEAIVTDQDGQTFTAEIIDQAETMAKKRAAKKTTSTAKGDRWAMLNSVADVAIRDLTGAETKIWLILFRDVRNGLARTSMADIARRAGLEPRSAKRAMRSLEARRLVKIVAHGTIDGKPNTYQLKMPT